MPLNLRVSQMNKNPQVDKFKEAARELETDNDEKRFDDKLKRIVKTTPPKEETAKESRGG